VDASVGNGLFSDSTRLAFHAVMRLDIRLAKISGGNQQVAYGQEMKDPVVIRVTDASKGGAPVAGVAVHWETSPPNLVPLVVDSITDDQGFARSRWRTACYFSAPQSIWVSIVGQTTNFDLTSVAGPQTRVVPVIAGTLFDGPPLLGAGDTVTVTANALDACSTATATPATWQARGSASIESPSAGTQAARALLRLTTPGTVMVSASANGMTGTIDVPVAARLSGIRQVGVGYDFSCALNGTGDVWCWGGSGGGGPFATLRVSGQRYKQLVVGAFHACVLDEFGRAFCWSMKATGGDPEPVQTSARFTKLSAGVLHTCGVTAAGEAMCWGGNLYGEIGDGTTLDRATPFTIPSSEHFTDVSAGAGHTCALSGGTPFCWGLNEPATPTKHISPVPLAHLASGGECGLTTDGALYCWSARGEVARVAGPPFASVSVGHSHTCASTSDGDVYCWRGNTFYAAGSLGDETFIAAPKLIADRDVRGQAVTGPLSDHSCVVTLESEVRCWGKVGALGNLRSNLLCVLTRELQLPCRPYGLPVLVKPD
jgi:hypothetical protein